MTRDCLLSNPVPGYYKYTSPSTGTEQYYYLSTVLSTVYTKVEPPNTATYCVIIT